MTFRCIKNADNAQNIIILISAEMFYYFPVIQSILMDDLIYYVKALTQKVGKYCNFVL